MKYQILLLVGCLTLQLTAQSTLNAKNWQDDLKFLQTTIHNDYPFLFKKTTDEAFDKAVDALYKAIPNLEEHEIIVGLARIVSSFKYGHTSLDIRHLPNAFHGLPVSLYHFNDGIYIQGVHKDYAETLGAKVIEVAGLPIGEALKAIYPVVPAENDQFFKAYGVLYLMSPEILHVQGVIKELSDRVELTLVRKGKTFKQTFSVLPRGERPPLEYGFVQKNENWLDARNQDNTPYYLKHLDKIYYYEYLPEQKTVYIRHSQIQDDESENIPSFYERVFNFIESNDVERLVLDVRLNGGGNNYKNKPIITGIIESEKINKVGHFFVIIGRRTFSACQNLVNELDNYTNAVFIGEPTAENINFYGDNNRVELPNSKVSAYLSFAWWQDKPQWEGDEWLAPHIAVDMSFEEYKSNKDPVLDTALNFSDTDFILDPMSHITNLFLARNMEKLRSDAEQIAKDPKYRFFKFEEEFNNTGYKLLNRGEYETAILVFAMITQFFPNSANAWDSLAEGYLKSGDTVKATEYYNKAIKMDPHGPTGDNARKMLRSITEEHRD